jgi:D-alanyl-lipoteichoic acid acyltransferase DltB (MBOAT superfamily)
LALGFILWFVVLKSPSLGQVVSAGLRAQAGQSNELASAFDLRWLGFSYLAFRLLHTLRDARTGRLPVMDLDEFLSYALFWSTYTAGPIDRITRFVTDLRQATERRIPLVISPENPLWYGLWRILWGIFKKFALADTLALVALNETYASQVASSGWMWVLLYAYSLRIYLDFSGYTDIAIGLGSLVGLKLPENFDRPYLKTNLTAFWNSWHITLAQWFRAYFFNPLTRSLRSNFHNFPAWLVIWIVQLSTMGLIGLWHGITWNFLIWGIWHGVGLFVHNRWLDWQRRRAPSPSKTKKQELLSQFAGWFATFQYITLGWVWFSLPETDQALQVFQKLFGM